VNLVRDNFPRSEITFLTSKDYAPLVEGFASANEVIALDRAAYRQWNLKVMGGHSIGLVRKLRRARLSLAVDFQGYGETALLTWLTGARRRWGCVHRRLRGWAYTDRVPRDSNLHPAEWNRALLAHCGLRLTPARNEFSLHERDLEAARQVSAARGCDTAKPTLYFLPFTSSPHKNWPLEKYLAVARFWSARGLQVLFGGG